jgi:hypothetical protein
MESVTDARECEARRLYTYRLSRLTCTTAVA